MLLNMLKMLTNLFYREMDKLKYCFYLYFILFIKFSTQLGHAFQRIKVIELSQGSTMELKSRTYLKIKTI